MAAAARRGIPGVDFPRETEENKDFFDYASDWTKMAGGIKDLLLKPVIQAFEIANLWGYERGPEADSFYKGCKEGKKALGAIELPSKINALRHEILRFDSRKPVRSMWEIAMKANECISPVCDGVEFLQSRHITHIPEIPIKIMSGVSSVSLLFGMGNSAAKSSYNIFKQLNIIAHINLTNAPDARAYRIARGEVVEAAKITSKKVQDLVKAVAYIAIAILSLAVLISGGGVALGLITAPLAIPAAIMVSLVTLTVIIGITAYFTNKMLDIEKLEKLQARRIAVQRAPVVVR